jgi:hypothetical protein
MTFWCGENCGILHKHFYRPKLQQDISKYIMLDHVFIDAIGLIDDANGLID